MCSIMISWTWTTVSFEYPKFTLSLFMLSILNVLSLLTSINWSIVNRYSKRPLKAREQNNWRVRGTRVRVRASWIRKDNLIRAAGAYNGSHPWMYYLCRTCCGHIFHWLSVRERFVPFSGQLYKFITADLFKCSAASRVNRTSSTL